MTDIHPYGPADAAPDAVEVAEKLDMLLFRVGDEHDLDILQDDARKMLHTVIVELERLEIRNKKLESALATIPDDGPDLVANFRDFIQDPPANATHAAMPLAMAQQITAELALSQDADEQRDEAMQWRDIDTLDAIDSESGRCACGAPAAVSVGYRGEAGPVLQCVRCATADKRSPFFHRKLNSPLEAP